jgi:CXXC zinc finger domain
MGQCDKKNRGVRPTRRLPIQSIESPFVISTFQRNSQLQGPLSEYAQPSIAGSNRSTTNSLTESMVETRRNNSSNQCIQSLRNIGSNAAIDDVETFNRNSNKIKVDHDIQTKSPDALSRVLPIVDNDENNTASFNQFPKRQQFIDGDNTNPSQRDEMRSPGDTQEGHILRINQKEQDDDEGSVSPVPGNQALLEKGARYMAPIARIRRGSCLCSNCIKDDCGACINCLGKVKFGGDGKNHQRCCERFCLITQHSNKAMVKRISKHTGAAYFTTYLGSDAKQFQRQSTETLTDTVLGSTRTSLNKSVNYKQNEPLRQHIGKRTREESLDRDRNERHDEREHNSDSMSTSDSSTTSKPMGHSSSDSDDVIIAHLKRMATTTVPMENFDDSSSASSCNSHYRDEFPTSKMAKKRASEELSISHQVKEVTETEANSRQPQQDKSNSTNHHTAETGRCRTTGIVEQGVDPSDSGSSIFYVRKRLRERIQVAHGGTVASTSTTNMSSSYYSEQHHTQRAHRVRCKKCSACKRPVCGLCYSCLSRKKHGGDGKSRQSRDPCLFRRCHIIYPPSNGKIDSYDDAHVIRNTNFFLDNFYTVFCHKARPDVEQIFAFNRYLLERTTDPKLSSQPIEDLLHMLHQQKQNQKGQKHLKRNSNELISAKSSSQINVLASMGSESAKQINQQGQKQSKRKSTTDTIKKQQQQRQLSHQQQNQRLQSHDSALGPEEDWNSLFLSSVMNALPKDYRKPASSVTRRKDGGTDGNESSSTSNSDGTSTAVGIIPKGANFYNSIINDMLAGRPLNTSNVDIMIPKKVVYDSVYKRPTSRGLGHGKNKNVTEECLYGIPIESDPGASSVCAGCRGANDTDDDGDKIAQKRQKTKKSKDDAGEENASEISSKADDSISSHATIESSNKIVQSTSQQPTETNTVLLCDGYKCGREYHLGCCIPSLSDVPDVERWLCVDCSPDNMTASLTKYLENFDETRASFYFNLLQQRRGGGLVFSDKRKNLVNKKGALSATAGTVPSYVLHLVQKDVTESDLPRNCDVPVSELERFCRTNYLALLDMSELARKLSSSNEGLKSTDPVPSFYEPLHADQFLGKPIRIYDALSNRYQTGRIVDYRDATTPDAVCRKRKRSKTETLPSETTDLLYQDTEFLIRFAAGKDGRKSSYYHWIVLEEHSLAVGMTLVWAKMQPRAKRWEPAIAWYRTARELVPVQHLLDGEKGEIYFQSLSSMDLLYSQKDLATRSRGRHFTNKPSKKVKRKAISLMRTFGSPEEYGLVDAKQSAVDLMNDNATAAHRTPDIILSYEIALAEVREQNRVRDWWHSIERNRNPIGGKMAYAGVSSQDYYRLPSLIPRTNYIADLTYSHRFGELQGKTRHRATSLCPNVQLGLDRKLVLQLLKSKDEKRNEADDEKFTVDDITNIVCDVIPGRHST